jgi:hypothetical protein
MLDVNLKKVLFLKLLLNVIFKGFKMPWTRQDTQEWIAQLENRVEDIEFYLRRTLEWCEDNEVYSDNLVFVCSVMTITWVCHLRNEPVSKKELFEILGIENWDAIEDAILEFNPKYESMELEDLLDFIVSSF